MIRRRSVVTLAAGAAVVPALVLGACGGGSDNSSSTTTTPKNPNAQSATVDVAKTGLGDVLVDSQGRTLYLFLADQGTTSECSGQCATNWPPVETSGTPTAGKGADESMIATTARSDGKTQVTYNGHPMYRFQGDKKAGDTNGEGLVAFGAGWFALSPAGNQVSGSASTPPPPPPAPATTAPPPPAPATTTPPAPRTTTPPPPPTTTPPPRKADPGVPQNGGGDGDADNNGGPDDGDGGV